MKTENNYIFLINENNYIWYQIAVSLEELDLIHIIIILKLKGFR